MFEILEGVCIVVVFEKVLDDLKKIQQEDLKGFKKILAKLEILSKRCYFNSPEHWKPLEGEICRRFNVWELKPKPYRLAFFKDFYRNKQCFIVYEIWRKKGKSKDKQLIEKICRKAYVIKEQWNYFKKIKEET